MKLDEFAFFNQQLAAMLRDGIPLESALGQLCSSMRHGELREELEKLRADLANGIPIKQALTARELPPFYVQMIQVGVQSNDLPRVLTLVAELLPIRQSDLDPVERLDGLSRHLDGRLVGCLDRDGACAGSDAEWIRGD